MPGPVPKPVSQVRRPGQTISEKVGLTLPAAGRTGDPPKWPLVTCNRREKVLWEAQWRKPQAVAWETRGWDDVVALYVRVLVAAEQPGASAGILAEARQMQDRLGLSPMSLLRLRWAISDEEAADTTLASGVLDIRQRLQAVDE